jgi:DNA-binding transcriptional LysR family regulator
LNGIGVALLSHLVTQGDIREGRLQSLMPDFPPLSFSIVYPLRRNLPPGTCIAIEFLAELIRADSQ